MKRFLASLVIGGAFIASAYAQVGVPSLPTIQNGYGQLSVSNSSINVSTVTTSPNSAAWAMPLFGNLVIYNMSSSAGAVYICPKGGTCSSSVGLEVKPGGSATFALGGATTSPTIIAASTATVFVGW